MKNKTLSLVLLLCGLILAALITRNGELLLLAIPIITYLLVGLARTPTKMTLIAKRTITPASVIAYENAVTQIHIANQGNKLVSAWCKDMIYPSMEILQGQERSRLFLSPEESVEINYEFKTSRGIYSWDAIQICASDPFGLFDLKVDVPAPGKIHVYPAPISIQSVNLRPRNTIHTSGPILARTAGSGTDFWGVREYKLGDSLRRINWQLTARHPDRLFTNEFESEEIADYGFILDSRILTNAEEIEEEILESSLSAVQSLAEDYLKNGNRVSLLIFGKPIRYVFPGYGKQQLSSLREELASAKLSPYIPFDYLKYFPVRLFPQRSVIIVFSSVEARDLEVYARLRSFGYDVLLISPDPIDLSSKSRNVSRLATRIARVERGILLNQLMSRGVKVIDWKIEEPLEKALRDFLERSRNWRN